MMPAGRGVLAVDLGGTRMRIAVFSPDATLAHKTVEPTAADGPSSLVEAMRRARETCGVELQGAAVGVPGPVAYDRGEPVHLPNLPAWEGRLSARSLARDLGLAVLLANDADLAALGEHRFGSGRGVQDMVYITSSTGVGGGVIIGGRLLHGRRSLGEIGHTVLDRATGATVEQLGSGTRLKALTGVDGAEAQRRAEAGDGHTLAAFREVAESFAIGVQAMVLSFMPERVVIGGGVSQAGDLLLGPVRERLDACEFCSVSGSDVVVAQCGDDVGLYGGFALWTDSMTEGAPSWRLTPALPEGDAG